MWLGKTLPPTENGFSGDLAMLSRPGGRALRAGNEELEDPEQPGRAAVHHDRIGGGLQQTASMSRGPRCEKAASSC